MANFAWIKLLRELSPATLTVRAQAIPANDRGKLQWQIYFPREDVRSTRLADILTLDVRAAADRRDWNAPGRLIPREIPPYRKLSMVPIESYDKIDEEEMQELADRFGGNGDLIQQELALSIPDRTDNLAAADYRRLELDTFRAWANGTIVVRNPQDASKTYTVSYGVDTSRYQTAGTAWNAVTNAYNTFLSWATSAADAVGPIEGAMMRLTTANEILADAPNLPNSVAMTRTQLNDRLTQDLGFPFEIVINENSVDEFDDGGTAKTRTKVWTAHKVAAIPVGKRVGYNGFAPVVRAREIANEVPMAEIDVNGVTVFYFEENHGKELVMEAQLNAMPVPNDQNIYVIDAGV